MSRPSSRVFAALLLASVALGLGGCNMRGGPTTLATAAPAAAPGSPESVAAAARHWGQRFQANPADEQAAFAYSRALLAQDQRAQAVAVLQRAVVANRQSRILPGELGKALAANGQFDEALNVFTRAHTRDRPDWRLLSAQGAVLDQMGRPQEARQHYQSALTIAPGEPAILTNLGLSHALTGDLSTAERHLRSAATHQRANERTRQNLAMVVGLQGRFEEAERIARQDLPPEKADENVALVRSMIAQRNTWSHIRNGTTPPRGPGATAAPATAEAPRAPRGQFAAPVLAEQAARATQAPQAPTMAQPVLGSRRDTAPAAAPATQTAATPSTPAATPAATPAPGTPAAREPGNLLSTGTVRRERVPANSPLLSGQAFPQTAPQTNRDQRAEATGQPIQLSQR